MKTSFVKKPFCMLLMCSYLMPLSVWAGGASVPKADQRKVASSEVKTHDLEAFIANDLKHTRALIKQRQSEIESLEKDLLLAQKNLKKTKREGRLQIPAGLFLLVSTLAWGKGYKEAYFVAGATTFVLATGVYKVYLRHEHVEALKKMLSESKSYLRDYAERSKAVEKVFTEGLSSEGKLFLGRILAERKARLEVSYQEMQELEKHLKKVSSRDETLQTIKIPLYLAGAAGLLSLAYYLPKDVRGAQLSVDALVKGILPLATAVVGMGVVEITAEDRQVLEERIASMKTVLQDRSDYIQELMEYL